MLQLVSPPASECVYTLYTQCVCALMNIWHILLE